MLIPAFAVCIMFYTTDEPWLRWTALGIFAAAAVSDGLDGFVARAYNQKTKLGAVLDPLADKLLMNIAFVFLAVNQELLYPLPKWFPVIMLSRDLIIVMGSYLINEYYGPVRVRPRMSGKLNTVFQMATIIAVLMEIWWSQPLIYLTLALSAISFLQYLRDGIKQVGNEDTAHD